MNKEFILSCWNRKWEEHIDYEFNVGDNRLKYHVVFTEKAKELLFDFVFVDAFWEGIEESDKIGIFKIKHRGHAFEIDGHSDGNFNYKNLPFQMSGTEQASCTELLLKFGIIDMLNRISPLKGTNT